MNLGLVYQILEEGSKKARLKAQETLQEIRNAIGLNYFEHK